MNGNKIKAPRRRIIALLSVLGALVIVAGVFFVTAVDDCSCNVIRREMYGVACNVQAFQTIAQTAFIIGLGLIAAAVVLLVSIAVSVFVQWRCH